MLEIFKQEKSFLTRAKEKSSFRYLLGFDTVGCFLEVCDTKLKPIKELDYRVYNGLDREILQLLQECKEENFFQISWEDTSEHIYLEKHPRLLELLRYSDKLIDGKNQPLSFATHPTQIDLHITQKEKMIALPAVENDDDFLFISSRYILQHNQIKQIRNIGENFQQLNNFDTTFASEKLEEFLTILMTHFENINIIYEDFEMVFKEEKKPIKPAVIFEQITSENQLVLRTSATIGKLSPQFFNDFNISKIVLVNELEKKITTYECDFSEVFELYSEIFKHLSGLKRTTNGESFSEEDGLFIIDETIATQFIQKDLHTLLDRCVLFGSEKLKAYKYNTSKPSLNVSFKEKIDFLDTGDVSVTIENESFNIFDLINLYKKHSYIPLSSGEKSIIDKNYIAKLERIFKKEGKEKIKVSFFDLPEVEEMITKKEQKIFQNNRKFYDGFNALKSSRSRIPKLHEVSLREYQKEGVRWLRYLYENNFGGCLADDMGLGKTLQTITLLSSIYPKEKKPSLVVMPRSLLNNWQNELKKFNPNLTFYLYYGNERDEQKISEHHITLTTYALVRNDIEKFQNIEFDTIILDESQNIKNIDSKISRAVMLLDGVHKFALSGTPIENSLFELYQHCLLVK